VDLDANQLIVAMLVSLVGFALFVYGKKQRRAPHLVAGIALMVYPYFVSSVVLVLLIAAALMGGLWLVLHLGA
jgi:hypothetical protein